METRKQYTKEFKLDAISLVLDQGLTIAEAARSLEIRANMLGRWIKENEADNNGQAFRGNGKLTPDQRCSVFAVSGRRTSQKPVGAWGLLQTACRSF